MTELYFGAVAAGRASLPVFPATLLLPKVTYVPPPANALLVFRKTLLLPRRMVPEIALKPFPLEVTRFELALTTAPLLTDTPSVELLSTTERLRFPVPPSASRPLRLPAITTLS